MTVADAHLAQEAEGHAEGDVAVRVRGLVNRFGSHTVHNGLDLDMRRGEVLGVIGGSGTGKSVLLRSIVGLHTPNAGEIEVFGQKLNTLSRPERVKVERRWGVMFQDGALFSTLTVRENVMAPMIEHTKIPTPLMRELADSSSGWRDWNWKRRPSVRPNFRAGCASGRRLRGRWRSIPSWFSSTNRPLASIRSAPESSTN